MAIADGVIFDGVGVAEGDAVDVGDAMADADCDVGPAVSEDPPQPVKTSMLAAIAAPPISAFMNKA